MLGYFPILLPDELFYSAAARYQEVMHFRSVVAVRKALFGSDSRTSVVDLPGHLDAFVERLPRPTPITSELLIRRHTLFPFFDPFVSDYRAQDALLRMRSGVSKGIHRLLNVTGPAVGTPSSLRLCVACGREDAATHGHPYWRRSHQLPGVFCCWKHERPLATTSALRYARIDRYGYQLLSPSILEEAIEPRVDDRSLELGIAISRDAMWLLEGKALRRDSPGMRVHYRAVARGVGWEDSEGRLQGRNMNREFLSHFGAAFFEHSEVKVKPADSSDHWPIRLFSQPFFHQSPVRHLTVLHFLGTTATEVYGAEVLAAPGPKPTPRTSERVSTVPCRNPTCPTFSQSAMDSLEGSAYGPRMTRVSCPTCQFTYSYDNNCPSIWRIIETGVLWDDHLRELVLRSDLPQAAIGRALGVRSEAMIRIAWAKGIVRKRWRPRGVRPPHPPKATLPKRINPLIREKHRSTVLAICRANPHYKRTEVRRASPTAFSWLETRDRAWLDRNVPVAIQPAGAIATLQISDEELAERAVVVAARLQLDGCDRPHRVSGRVLAKELSIPGSWKAALRRFPRTSEAFATSIETFGAFAYRRVRWATARFVAEGARPSRTTLARRAGFWGVTHAARAVKTFEVEYARMISEVEAMSMRGPSDLS
jgi:hypothetical protein